MQVYRNENPEVQRYHLANNNSTITPFVCIHIFAPLQDDCYEFRVKINSPHYCHFPYAREGNKEIGCPT